MAIKRNMEGLYSVLIILIVGILMLVALSAHIYSVNKNYELDNVVEDNENDQAVIRETIYKYIKGLDKSIDYQSVGVGKPYDLNKKSEQRSYIADLIRYNPEIKAGIVKSSDLIIETIEPASYINELKRYDSSERMYSVDFDLSYEVSDDNRYLKLEFEMGTVQENPGHIVEVIIDIAEAKEKVLPEEFLKGAVYVMADSNGDLIIYDDKITSSKRTDIYQIVEEQNENVLVADYNHHMTRLIDGRESLVTILDLTDNWKLYVFNDVKSINSIAMLQTFSELSFIQLLIGCIIMIFMVRISGFTKEWFKKEKSALVLRSKQLEESALKSENVKFVYEEIYNKLVNPIILVDPNINLVVNVNNRGKVKLGMDVVNENLMVDDIFFFGDIEGAEIDLWKGVDVYQIQGELYNANGEYEKVDLQIANITINDHRLVAIEVLEKTEEKLEVVYNNEIIEKADHELRRPLNGMLGMVNLLNKTELSQEQADYLGMIKTSISSMDGVINEFLSSDGDTNDYIELHPESFNLKEVIENTIKPYKLNNYKALEINCHISKESYVYVIGDVVKLKHIIENLVNNSYKYTDVGFLNLEVDTVRVDEKIRINFQLTDTGIGISDKKINDIFELHVRDDETVKNKNGRGIGLSMAKEYIQILGGEIGVESTLGKGSLFEFYVVMEIDPEKTKMLMGNNPVEEEWVLIADDDEISIKYFEKLLVANVTSHITAVRLGNDAIDCYKERHYKYVFLDYEMSDISGVKVAKEIRRFERDTDKKAVIIALTGKTRSEYINEMYNAGIDEIIAKPIDEEILLDVFEKYSTKKVVSKVSKAIDIPALASAIAIIGEETMNEMIAIFLSENSDKMDEIYGHFRSHEIEELLKVLHKLKGSVSYFRPQNLVGSIVEIESLLIEDSEEVEHYLREFKKSFKQFKKELSEISYQSQGK